MCVVDCQGVYNISRTAATQLEAHGAVFDAIIAYLYIPCVYEPPPGRPTSSIHGVPWLREQSGLSSHRDSLLSVSSRRGGGELYYIVGCEHAKCNSNPY